MKVPVVRIDPRLPLPKYETSGSVGFDLLARVRTRVPARSFALIPANIIVNVPKNTMLIVASRSSTPLRKGLITPHGFGVIDHDYCGRNDEIKIQVYNITGKPVTVFKGEKIAQGIFVHISKAQWQPALKVRQTHSRGGFGSTNRGSSRGGLI